MKNSIWSFVPYDHEGNIADAYNRYCEVVPNDNDWIILWDADLMVLTPKYEHLMFEVAERNPQYSLWTIYTNRVTCRPQLIKSLFEESDIREHRKKALELYENYTYSVKDIHRSISGYCMMFKKKTWEKIGFSGKGLFGVDTIFSNKIRHGGGKIGLMEGVYGFHYYRFNEGVNFQPYKNNKK